jgi:hypothetical protein
MGTNDRTAGRRGLQAWAALGGVAYVVLYFIGILLIFDGEPDGDAPPAKFIEFFGDSGHQDRMSLGWMLAALGVFFFLFFVASLRQTVSRFDRDGLLAALTAIGGGIYAALALTSIGLEVGVRTMSDDTYQHQVFPEIIHAAGDAGYVIHASGGVGLGMMILAAAIAFIRSGVVPKWAGWLSVVAALAALATIMFFTTFLWWLWILVTGIVLFWKGRGAADAAAG